MSKKFTDEELFKLEKFAREVKSSIERFKQDTDYLLLTDEQRKIHQKAIEIIERKFEEMVKAKNRKKLKNVVRLKKILDGDRYGKI